MARLLHRLMHRSSPAVACRRSRAFAILLAVPGPRDMALLVMLAVVVLPDLRGLLCAGATVFFYPPLALLVSLLPSRYITRWLLRQAPGRVPVCEWIMRLLDERWRSFVLFLT